MGPAEEHVNDFNYTVFKVSSLYHIHFHEKCSCLYCLCSCV